MSETPSKREIDFATLIAIGALVVSVISLIYARDAARSAVALVRPQLKIYCSNVKHSGKEITGKLFIENIGQTTAVIYNTKLFLCVDTNSPGILKTNIYSSDLYMQGDIIYKNSTDEADFKAATSYDYGGRSINYLDQIKEDGGITIEVNFECQDMPDTPFVDSVISRVTLK